MLRFLFCQIRVWAIGWIAPACVVLAWGASLEAAEPADLKVMSFNIRYSTGGADEASSDNNWNDSAHPRRDRAIRVIRETSPDILGLQEPREHQIEDLRIALPEMAFYGVGRDDGRSAGEYAGIFYRKDRFTPIDQGTFWLSSSPTTPGTSFYTGKDSYPRIASWIKLADKQSGRQFLVLCTHWEWQDAAAREQSAQLIRKELSSLAKGLPVILLGDFNAPEDTAELLAVRGVEPPAEPQLADSYRKVHPEQQPDELSYHAYKGTIVGPRIDFILHSKEFEPIDAAILRTRYEGLWPSDHYPVTATLRMRSEQ